ncbi:MAG: aspartate aminotransferase family protein [Planctomycetota bacterium]
MTRYPLEPDGDAFRAMADEVIDRLAPLIDRMQQTPYWDWPTRLDERARAHEPLREPLPDAGIPLGDALNTLFHDVYPFSFAAASPGFVAYIPAGGLPSAALAQLIAAVFNAYPTIWHAGPAVAQIELTVLRWFAAMVGFPPDAHGYLASGGSMSGFSALITARKKKLPENFLAGTIYSSDQSHFWIHKAALLAGFPQDNVRLVPTDERQRMRVDVLREMIDADRAAGRQPFFVSATAGTVHTGAVDDMAAIADVCADTTTGAGCWMHVDAAYGGFFMLTARGREILRGIDRADSITLDPHKGLFLPYGVGGLLVKDRAALRAAHSVGGGKYIPDMQDNDDRFDATDVSPELTRGFRALQVWLPLKLHGAAAFVAQLDEKLDLAQRFADGLRDIPFVRLIDEPQLSLVGFRLDLPGLNDEFLDRVNQELIERVLQRGRFHMSGTWVNGRFVCRMCVLGFRTHAAQIDQGLEDIREVASGLCGYIPIM